MRKWFVLLLAALMLFVACQPTPESPIVVGKDQNAMIEKAESDASYREDAVDGVNWAERLNVPSHYSANLVSGGRHLKVDVDARVVLPETELPIVRLKTVTLSDDDVKRIVTALLGETPKCVDYDTRSRALIEREIAKRNEDLAHWDEYGSFVWDMNYETRGELEESIHQLMREAAEAPEEVETFAPRYEWEYGKMFTASGEEQRGTPYLVFHALNPDGTRAGLSIYNAFDDLGANIHYQRDGDNPVSYPTDGAMYQNELNISEADAMALAKQTLERMGFPNLTCTFSKSIRSYRGDIARVGVPYKPCWAFGFTTTVNGAAATYTMQRSTEQSDYAALWMSERAIVTVDDEGIVSLDYNELSTCGDVEVEAAKLMPFSDVSAIFEKMVLIVDNLYDVNGIDRTLRVTEVRLGLVSIPGQNGTDGILVPAWDFMGSFVDRTYMDELTLKTGVQYDESYSFLTVNAVDGSIIQRGD